MEKDKIRKILGDKDNKILRLEKELERMKKSLRNENYGLAWIDVPEAFEDDVENKLPIVTAVPKLDIKNNDGKATHLLIEAENYHALTCLNYTHKGKVDVIYIDPPYNTGSDGFRYKDKRVLDKYPDGAEVPTDHPLRHSYWLSFMRKRLELAKDLLSDKGVIFVSIDDNEFAQLKVLCDQIFNEKNLVGVFTWIRKKKGSNLSKEFRKITEYVLAYKKGEQITLFGQKAYDEKEVPLLNRANRPNTLSFPANKILAGSGVSDGKIKAGDFGKGDLTVTLLNDIKVEKGVVTTPFSIKGRFRWAQGTVDDELEGGSVFTFSKTFRVNVARHNQGDKFKSPSSLLSPEDGIGTNEDATEELRRIFPEFSKLPFDYPKPASLIKYLVASVVRENKKAIVLDFFAGSGTTAQSVMELNNEDEGNRQSILVTNDEGKIMSTVCYPRITRVMKGYEGYKGLGGSLKYYRIGFVGEHSILNTNDKDKLALAHNACELLAIAENTLDGVTKNSHFEIFENKDRHTAIYFKESFDKFDDFTKKVLSLKKPTTVYIFSWENDPFVDEFEDNPSITVKTIPEPILEIYRRIHNL